MQETKSFAVSRALLQVGFNRSAAQCKLRRYVRLNDNEVDEARVHEGLMELANLEKVYYGRMMKEAVVDEIVKWKVFESSYTGMRWRSLREWLEILIH